MPCAPGWHDWDGDGFGGAKAALACGSEPGFAHVGGDCNDHDPTRSPGVAEVCDQIDNDCDGQIDNDLPLIGFFIDVDQDGFGDPDKGLQVQGCSQPPGYSENAWDCDDTNPAVHPAHVEVCDQLDNDCDQLIDTADPSYSPDSAPLWFPDEDGDGFGAVEGAFRQCADPGVGHVLNGNDCFDHNPLIHPAADEVCNGYDDNCDQLIDDSDPLLDPTGQRLWYEDADLDGVGNPKSFVWACFQPSFHVANGGCSMDDPDDPWHRWLADPDHDGVGSGSPVLIQCAEPWDGSAAEAVGVDCAPEDPDVHPLAREIYGDDVDQDCDGVAN